MSGFCVRQFLENTVSIMEKIKELVCERQNIGNRTVYDNRCTEDELIYVVDTYANLFEVMDCVFFTVTCS